LDEVKNDGRIAREQLKNVPQRGSVWTFALMPD
jgi:hypothetical protein